jgi:hypothetical protein
MRKPVLLAALVGAAALAKRARAQRDERDVWKTATTTTPDTTPDTAPETPPIELDLR